MKNNNSRRILASTLVLLMLGSQAAVAAAPTVETDESVYINLDYYGVPTDTRIVKGVSLNGLNSFTDYGNYTDVYNMSTYDQPQLENGSVTWQLGTSASQRFYYECIPDEKETIELPWTFDISYKLDGVPVKAEECAGADGLVEITIDTTANDAASEYYKNNMMLICATGIDMSKALSIDAPGAQIQSIGTYKIVVFMGLPGEDNTFTARIGSDSFESMGVVMFMAPITLSSMDILSDLKDVKDRLSDSSDDLYTGLNEMLTSFDNMQSGFNTLSGGIAGIDTVRKQLIDSRGTIDPATDAALAELDALAGQSDSLIPELTSMQTTITDLNTTVTHMLSTMQATSEDIKAYQDLLIDVQTSLDDINSFLDDWNDETASDELYLNDLSGRMDDLRVDMEDLSEKLDDLSTYANRLYQQAAALEVLLDDPALASVKTMLTPLIQSAFQTAGALDDMTRSLKDSVDGISDLLASTKDLTDHLQDIQDMMDEYDNVPYDLVGEGKRLTTLLNTTLTSINTLLDDIPALTTTLNQITLDSTSAITKGTSLIAQTKSTLTAASKMLSDVQDTLRSVRAKSDASMQTSIDGLLDVLAKASNATQSTGSLKDANDSINAAKNDAENDLEEDTNVLNIDSAAELQSVTSSENETPTSVQFILRTEEISVEEDDKAAAADEAAKDEGMFARIAKVFKKLFAAIVGVFQSDE